MPMNWQAAGEVPADRTVALVMRDRGHDRFDVNLCIFLDGRWCDSEGTPMSFVLRGHGWRDEDVKHICAFPTLPSMGAMP